jgi:hypothetical protein
MAKASHALSAPRPGRNSPPITLHEWRSAVSVWAALPPYSCRRFKVCKHLLELQTRLGSEASLFAQEARQ